MIKSPFLFRDDRKELLACVKRQCEEQVIAQRANALLLLDDDTVRNWHKQCLLEGWDAVAYDGWKGG